MEMRRLYVGYHGSNCADGFCAAWIARKALGHEAAGYLPLEYGQPPPDEVIGQEFTILDFCYSREVLRVLTGRDTAVRVLDHHVSAMKEFRVPEAPEARRATSGYASERPGGGSLTLHFDMDKSGARLAWENYFPVEPAPAIVGLVEDRDLWRWALPDSRELNAWLRSFKQDYDVWDMLAEDLEKRRDQCVIEGAAILRAQQQVVDALVAGATVRTVMVPTGQHGYKNVEVSVPVVNATAYTSEVGEALREAYPEAPFTVTYQDRAGRRIWSLRTAKPEVDVSVLARELGGGGHRAASGFTTDIHWMPPRV